MNILIECFQNTDFKPSRSKTDKHNETTSIKIDKQLFEDGNTMASKKDNKTAQQKIRLNVLRILILNHQLLKQTNIMRHMASI